MNKLIFAIPLVAVLAACGTTGDVYEKRGEAVREQNNKAAERAVDRAPKWMNKLPESKDAVYAHGSATSSNFSMADRKAKMFALSDICVAAGGTVENKSSMYVNDDDKFSGERSEMATVIRCRGVDVTGAEVVEVQRVAERGQIRSYVLMSLPMADANVMAMRRDAKEYNNTIKAKADAALKELNGN